MRGQLIRNAINYAPWRPTPYVEEVDGIIYFIGEKDKGPIKTGFTSNNDPKKRLQGLQTGYPYELCVLGFIRGGRSKEKEIHKFLHPHRHQGEWFERDAALAVLNYLTRRKEANAEFANVLFDTFNNACTMQEDEENEEDSLQSLAASLVHDLLFDKYWSLKDADMESSFPLYAWLISEDREDGPVNDLAQDAKSDKHFPRVGTLVDYLRYGKQNHFGCDVMRTIVDAWIECNTWSLH